MFRLYLRKGVIKKYIENLPVKPMTRQEFNNKLSVYSKLYYVYSLSDESGIPFYIGKGCAYNDYHAIQRPFTHENLAKAGNNSDLSKHIRNLLRDGKSILYRDIYGTNKHALILMFEAREIEFFGRKKTGGLLFNKTSGYQGCNGFHLSEETKLKLSRALKGRKLSKEHKRKVALGLQNSQKFKDYHTKTRKPIIINGEYFSWIGDAVNKLKIPRSTIYGRLSRNSAGYERDYTA